MVGGVGGCYKVRIYSCGDSGTVGVNVVIVSRWVVDRSDSNYR